MIYLATPIWRYLDVRTAHSITAAIAFNAPREVVVWETIDGDALISRTRSQLATKFLLNPDLKDADVMVIIDDDVQFQPEDVWKIVEGARRTGGLYGGVYVTRSREPHPAALGYPGQQYNFQVAEEPDPIEIRYLATGFMAVPRAVLQAMLVSEFEDADGKHALHFCRRGVGEFPSYDFFRPFVIEEPTAVTSQIPEFAAGETVHHYLSEDWAFCERAKQIGFKVWADQSIMLGHRAVVTVTVQDIITPGHALSKDGAPSSGTTTIVTQPEMMGSHTQTISSRQPKKAHVLTQALADKQMVHPLVTSLPADIAEFFDQSLDEAWQLIGSGQRISRELFRDKPEDQTAAEWYARADVGKAYIGDLAAWHLRGSGVPLLYASRLSGKRVLDYGCGIGMFAIVAAQAGAEVSVYEPSPEMRVFLRWRAEKYGAGIKFVDEDVSGTFDAIVCWHVFEHVDEPESLLDGLLYRLKPDGVLVSDDGFGDQHTAQHHAHPDWAGVMADRGLEANEYGWFERVMVTA